MKKITALVLALVLCLSLAACSGGNETPSVEDGLSGTVTVYTSVPQDLADRFKSSFEDKYTGVTVNIYRATAGEVLTKIKTEAEGGQVSGDIVWVADFSSAESLKALNLLEKYTSSEDAAIDASLKDAEGYYYGSRIINMVLAYNTMMLTEAPTSWNDLLTDTFTGKTGLPSTSSGSAFQYIGVMSENADFGWDYFQALKDNGGMQFKSNSDVLQRIATSEIWAGPVLDYMVTEMKEQGSPVDFVIPEEGAIVVASPIAKLANCKNPELAELFIDYTLSVEGQQILADMNTTPVRTDVETPDHVLSLSNITVMEDNKTYLTDAENVKSKFAEIFG